MKNLIITSIFFLISLVSFSQKNINVFATDFYDFTMTLDELTYFINTDSTLNKWTYMESYESDYFMVFNVNFKENKLISSIDYGDTLNNYNIIYKNDLNKKNTHLIVSESNTKSQILIIYKNNKPYRLINYRVDGNYAIGYLAKNVSLQ
jgi:hypothetical protein